MKICYISVVVIGQPQQQRQGQQNTTITTSMMALTHLQGRQMTSVQQPILVEQGDRATAVCEFAQAVLETKFCGPDAKSAQRSLR
jgi:hypothetical protein